MDNAIGNFACVASLYCKIDVIALFNHKMLRLNQCKFQTINLYGSGKNRFQLEIPDTVRVPDDYEVTSSKKGFKRYWTEEVKDFLARTTNAEDRRDAALKDIMRRIFFAFDKQYAFALLLLPSVSVSHSGLAKKLVFCFIFD